MRFRLKKMLRNENGAALVIVLLIATIAMIIGLSSAQMALSNTKFNAKERQYQAVYYIAESGLTYAKNEIQHIVSRYQDVKDEAAYFHSIEKDIKGIPNTYNDFEPSYGEKPEANIVVEPIIDDKEDHMITYKINSIGKIGEMSRTVEQEVEIHWIYGESGAENQLLDHVGVFAEGSVSLKNNSLINGNVGTNDKAITMKNNAKINGDKYVNQNVSANLPQLPTYSQGESPHQGNWELNSNLSIDEITLDNNDVLYIDVGNADRSVVVNKLFLDNNAKIYLIGQGHLTLYVKDSFTMDNNAVFNNSSLVNHLKIFYYGNEITLKNNSNLYGLVFAKRANVLIRNNGQITGAVYANELTLDQNAKIDVTSNLSTLFPDDGPTEESDPIEIKPIKEIN